MLRCKFSDQERFAAHSASRFPSCEFLPWPDSTDLAFLDYAEFPSQGLFPFVYFAIVRLHVFARVASRGIFI